MKICPKCQATHSKFGIFCSRTCANSRGPRTKEFKSKIRQKLLKPNPHQCLMCQNLIMFGKRKNCSDLCLISYKKTQKPPRVSGGYRHGSGRGKHGWYKGYYLDSNYELAFLIYCLNHNILITRNKTPFQYINKKGKKCNYYPDFRVNGRLTEIKGYYTDDLEEKLSTISEPIDVLFPKDLEHVFSYVENLTGLKIQNLYCLYENGVPTR